MELWNIFCEYTKLSVSAIIFSIGIAASLGIWLIPVFKKIRKKVSPIAILMIVTAVCVFGVNFLVCDQADGVEIWNGLDRFCMAVSQTLATFSGEQKAGDTRELMIRYFNGQKNFFLIYVYFLHFSASSTIGLLIFNLFSKFFPRVGFHFSTKKRLCVFSGISEREVLLAEDIRKNEQCHEKKKSVIVFLNEKDEFTNENNLTDRLREITKYVFRDEVASLYIPSCYLKGHIDYYLLKEDDSENINDALLLAEKYAGKNYDITIHILSDNSETQYLLDSVAERSNCNFSLINETKSMLYQLLDQEPLFLGEKDGQLTILIVGAGRTGLEAAKICSWCGYTMKLEPKILLLDKSFEPMKKLEKECPELIMHSSITPVCMNVETPEFIEFLRNHTEIGYVICALGDEHLNLRTALDIRGVAYEKGPYNGRSKRLPLINVLLNNMVLYKACEELQFATNSEENAFISYGVNAFGSFAKFYSQKNMGKSYLEGNARAVHRYYTGGGMTKEDFDEAYRKSNYNRESSRAAGLHGKYKAYAILCELNKEKVEHDEWRYTREKDAKTKLKWTEEKIQKYIRRYLYDVEIEPEERTARVEKLAELEHKRWNGYMRSIGWCSATEDQVKEWRGFLNNSKNLPAKLQQNIAPWDKLDDGIRNYDKELIWNLPFIMKEGYEYDETIVKSNIIPKSEWSDMGNYTEYDFEAICFWLNYKNISGKTLRLIGPAWKIDIYIKQAILLQIFADGYSECEVYILSEDAKSEYKEYKDSQINKDNDNYRIAMIKEQLKHISFCEKEKLPKGVNKDPMVEECNLDEPSKYKENFISETKDTLIYTAKKLHEEYNNQNKKKEDFISISWSELDEFSKGSNICAASFIHTHQRNFKKEMPIENMAEVEHIRWCMYHFINGWDHGYVKDATKYDAENGAGGDVSYEELESLVEKNVPLCTKDAKKKWHACLIPYDELEKLKVIRDYQENDRKNVRQVLQGEEEEGEQQNKMNNLRKMLSYYKSHMREFLTDMFFASLSATIALTIPLIIRYVTSKLIYMETSEILSQIVSITIGLLVLVAVDCYSKFYISNQGHVMGAKIEHEMRAEIFDHFQKLSFSFYDDQKVGQLMSRITSDLFEITELLHHGPENLILSIVKIIGALCILLSINPILALAAFAVLPFMFTYAYFLNKKMRQAFRQNRAKIAEINAQIEDNLSGIRVVKSFANEKIENEKFKEGNDGFLAAKKNSYFYMGSFHSGLGSFTTLIQVNVIVIGTVLIAKGSVNVSDLLTFLLYISVFTDPVRTLIDFTEQFQNGYSGFERFMEIMNIEPDIKDMPYAKELLDVKGDITFEDVSFQYKENTDKVLNHINLHVPAGSYMALVGSSGAGKSTLCSLIPRFYDVTGGAIRIDGEDIRDVKLESLRNKIGIVQQDVYLFAGTIMENIRYGKPKATDEEIIQAAKNANAHDFIMSFPEGYQTDIGQRGIKLSGGQKQRLSIARVFLKNPPILIFDEATSALDNESEKVVQDSLEKLAKNRTTFVIAHRLSTIKNAEKILVLSENGIEEEGTHEELLAKKGIYEHLYMMQFITTQN